ncbi:serine hydrolase [Aquimarina sp. Aq78]|uniref:serine hydrolase domain-containing protein n=1 Tax=Aquimarina sp. Aq78 TaxID=1191889 RepID=UPI000D1116B1|nr:serine hydrolase [Aquimarina sp. Aq78]
MKKYLLLFLLSFSICSFGQPKESQAIDNLFSEWNKPDVPGGAIGIIKNGKLIYSNGYGIGNLEHNIEITPSSVFYIGSVSKQFVTFSILLLEEQGKLNLDDRIQKYLPDFPEYDTPLTIRHFIHHTSGVRDYFTLMYLKGRNYLDDTNTDEIYGLIKKQEELNFLSGEKHLYSNSCYFMLAMIVEKVAGQSLKIFAHENIFQPLGMKNTLFYDDNTDLIKNRVFSYNRKSNGEGFNNLIMRFDLVGSGGIYSNIEDLFLWDQNFYNNKLGKGGQEIIERMHEEGLLNNGESSGYAFALNNGIYKGLKTVSHGGALAGYQAQLIRFPKQKFSVIILANRDDANPTRKSFQITDMFLKENFINDEVENQGKKVNNKQGFVHLKTNDLEKFSGHYWNDEGSYTRKLYVKNDTLRYYRSETNESDLIPISKHEFKMINVGSDVLVKFDKNEQGNYTMFFSVNGGKAIISKEYHPKNYTNEELIDFVGTYYSKELDINYTLKIKNKLLVLYINEIEISPLNSIMVNLFSNEEYGVFHFKTDGYGKVSGFRLNTGRVTNLKFQKK